MKTRCTNPKATRYPEYGGRGITVCERWNDFANFLADMGERPVGMTIDRRDNDLGYFKENCRWATHLEQTQNRANAIKVVFRGESMFLTVAAKLAGISYTNAVKRHYDGRPLEF